MPGVNEDPYSIFTNEVLGSDVSQPENENERGEGRENNNSRKCSNRKPAAARAPAQHPQGRSNPSHPTVVDLVKDEDDADSSEKYNFTICKSGTVGYLETFEEIQSSFTAATDGNDQDSIAFYGYLLRYFRKKSEGKTYNLGSE